MYKLKPNMECRIKYPNTPLDTFLRFETEQEAVKHLVTKFGNEFIPLFEVVNDEI